MAEKYFVFKKDGYMVSKPYQNEIQISQSTSVFNKLRLSDDGDPKSEEGVGDEIAQYVGGSKDQLVGQVDNFDILKEYHQQKKSNQLINMKLTHNDQLSMTSPKGGLYYENQMSLGQNLFLRTGNIHQPLSL